MRSKIGSKGKRFFIEDNMCTIYKLVLHKIQGVLVDNGWMLSASPEHADFLLLGLCAAFEADEERSISIVEKMKTFGKPIYVYGCMTQVNPQKLGMPLQSLFASWQAADLVNKLLKRTELSRICEGGLPVTFRRMRDYRVYNPRKRFIGISTGCSFTCSYCPHRLGAGDIRSVPKADILNLVAKAVMEECQTIVITGIDTACYGADIGGSFHSLLEEILEGIGDHVGIHIAQFNPEGLFNSGDSGDQERLLRLWSDNRIKDIQLPIQSASQRLLSVMNRHYSIDSIDAFLLSLKKMNPKVMLRTDLLIGFPTETIEELDVSIEFVIRHYSEVALYVFEMKQGTPLFNMNIQPIPPEEAQWRLQYATEKLQAVDLLVHGGGQRIETLLTNDRKKETISKC